MRMDDFEFRIPAKGVPRLVRTISIGRFNTETKHDDGDHGRAMELCVCGLLITYYECRI